MHKPHIILRIDTTHLISTQIKHLLSTNLCKQVTQIQVLCR